MIDQRGLSTVAIPRATASTKGRMIGGAAPTRALRAPVSLTLVYGLVIAACLVAAAVSVSGVDDPYGWIAPVSVLAFAPVLIGLVTVTPAYIWAAWVLFFPLGYYFLTFPHERALFTFDRGITAAVFCAALIARRAHRSNAVVRPAALLWFAYVAVAGFSIRLAADQLASFRVWFDSLLLPVFMGWAILRSFNPKRDTELLIIVVSAAAVVSAFIGVAELIRGEDLLPLAGAGLYFTGSIDNPVLRANGPFLTNNSLALIGLVGVFFLQFLLASTSRSLRSAVRVWALCGTAALLVIALLPMFRSVLLTIAIIAIAEVYRRRGRGALLIWISIAAFVALVAGVMALSPDIARDRIWDYDNILGRLVQYEQTSRLLQERPWFGVGLDNFNQAALASPWAFDRNGVAALDYSHSNLGSAFAETGLVGGSLYVMAHGALLLALLSRTKNHPLARRYGLYMFLAYWVSGLTLASGFYGDLNTWYLLCLAVVFCHAADSVANPAPRPVLGGRR